MGHVFKTGENRQQRYRRRVMWYISQIFRGHYLAQKSEGKCNSFSQLHLFPNLGKCVKFVKTARFEFVFYLKMNVPLCMWFLWQMEYILYSETYLLWAFDIIYPVFDNDTLLSIGICHIQKLHSYLFKRLSYICTWCMYITGQRAETSLCIILEYIL